MPIARTTDYKVMERISEILKRLEAGERLSVKELAIEYGCDTKTIQRDINNRLPELLKQLNTGIKIQRVGRLISLSGDIENLKNFDDVLTLDILGKLSEGMGANFSLKAKNILQKLQKTSAEEHIYAKVHFEDVTDKADDVLALEVAMGKQTTINFRYEIDDSPYEVSAKPLKLICFDGYWYLLAEDEKDTTIKKYYLRSISNIVHTNKSFTVKKTIKDKLQNAINVWFDAHKESYEVRIWADKSIAKYFSRRPISKSQRVISTDADGSVELSVMVTDDFEIIPTIFYWIPNLIVLSPEPLKKRVESMTKEFIEKISIVEQL